jgi:hypothetical protein
MRIEYESHQYLPGGILLLWVLEQRAPTFAESVLTLLRRDRLARPNIHRRFYAFDRACGRWLDESKTVVLATDPRHMRLLELVVAQRIQDAVDQLVGL